MLSNQFLLRILFVLLFLTVSDFKSASADLLVTGDDYLASAYVDDFESVSLPDNRGVLYQYENGAVEVLGNNQLGDLGDYFTAVVIENEIDTGSYEIQATMSAYNASGAPTIWVREGVTTPTGGEYIFSGGLFGWVTRDTDPTTPNGIALSNTNVRITSVLTEFFRKDGSIFATSERSFFAQVVDSELAVGSFFSFGFRDVAGIDFHSVRYSLSIVAIPEPSSGIIFTVAGLAIALRRRRSQLYFCQRSKPACSN